MRAYLDGVLWAYWPGINVGATFEIDVSGNGHTLYLTDTTITERLDGTGSNYANEVGFTVADGSQYIDDFALLPPSGTIVPYPLNDVTDTAYDVAPTLISMKELPALSRQGILVFRGCVSLRIILEH